MPPTREELLSKGDLVEKDVPLPSIGLTVKIRSLPAAYSNEATSQALEMVTGRRGEQTAKVNTVKLEALQVLHALIEPKLNTIEDAFTLQQNTGRAWRTLVSAIDEISGVDKESIEKANAQFRDGGSVEGGSDLGNGNGSGDGGPDLRLPAGPGDAHASEGAG